MYDVRGLVDYTKENRDVLVRSIVLGTKYGDTIPYLRKQLGVKCSEPIHLLDTDPVFQDGEGCGFSAAGSTILSDRVIETAPIKINSEWCPDDLLCSYAEWMVRYGANANAEGGLPFESEILSDIEKKTNDEMERLVWQGDSSNGDLIDGFITRAAGADSASTINISSAITSADTAYDKVKKVIMAIPEEIIDKAVVFVSPSLFRELAFQLVEDFKYNANLFNGEVEATDIVFPATDIKVHKTKGLKNAGVIYASTYDNLVYGTDLMNDKEEMRLWFSDDADLYRLKVKWNAGVQTIYPDMVVIANE